MSEAVQDQGVVGNHGQADRKGLGPSFVIYKVGDRLPGSLGTIDTSNWDARVSPLTLVHYFVRCLMLR